jgi:spermidine/putrescine transport system substrate-binding protein
MKKLSVFLVLASALFLFACGGGGKKAQSLNIYTWQDYVPDSVVAQFEKETGIKINYSFFSTNEEMLAKLEAVGGGQYDLILCSDYIIDLMRSNTDLLDVIDTSKIPNYGNIDPRFLSKYYDPANRYTVPYWVSSSAIVYNPARTNLTFESFADLADPSLKGGLAVVDDPRMIISASLKVLGHDYNETNPAIIEQAKPFLDKLRPNIMAFNTDGPQNLVVNGDAIASYQTGAQAVGALFQDGSLKISYPREGGNVLYIDSFVIPKGAPNLENAYTFLELALRPEVGAMAAEYTRYHNTNRFVNDLLTEQIAQNLIGVVPDSLIENAEMFTNLGEGQQVYDRIWTEFK